LITHRPTLLEGDVAAHLRRLSAPLIWSLMTLTGFSVIDAAFIARLGTDALAAMGFAMPVMMISMGVVYGLSVGTTSVLSRVYGEGDVARGRRLATDALTLTFVTVCGTAIIGLVVMDDIFRMMGAESAIVPMIRSFMIVWYGNMIFTALLLVGNACVRATGDTRFPAFTLAAASILSILLDPCLIFGLGPFPRLGLTGSAVTVLLVDSVVAMTSLYIIGRRKKALSPDIFHPGVLDSWKKILHVGLPSIISNQISPLSAAVVTWLVADIGSEAVAAFGVATRIEGMAVIVFYALGTGVSIFTGQNFGAGNYGRVAEIAGVAAKYCLIWGLFVAGTLFAFARDIPEFFDSDAAVVGYTAQYLRIVPVSYGAMGVLVTANAALNAMGRPFPATVLIILRAFALYVPLAWVGEKYAGFTGILLALAATNVIVSILSHLWHKKLAS
jgi:putative MATE family efflux protein